MRMEQIGLAKAASLGQGCRRLLCARIYCCCSMLLGCLVSTDPTILGRSSAKLYALLYLSLLLSGDHLSQVSEANNGLTSCPLLEQRNVHLTTII